MKNTLSLIAVIGAMTLAAAPALAGDVVINLEGVEAAKGDLYVSLQTQDQFLKNTGAYGAMIKAPKSGQQVVVLKDVAPGDYSVSVWHDIDADHIFSMSPSGMPADGWSMHNAKALRSAPTWDAVKFNMQSNNIELPLKMIYPK
jgi:uncharacterized protein (DUF2141 family)